MEHGRHLPYPDSFFDGVVACNTIGRWARNRTDLLLAFQEVNRVTDKNNRKGLISTLTENGGETLFAEDQTKEPIQFSLADIDYLNPRFHQGVRFDQNKKSVDIYYLSVGDI